MPIVWSTFQLPVSQFLDTAVPKSERDTARFIANQYVNTVRTAGITLIPGSTIISTPPATEIENGIFQALDLMKSSSPSPPNPTMFLPWANATLSFWRAVVWSPIPPPPGYISPTTGVTTLFSGTPSPLDIELWNAFNNTPANVPLGNVVCSKLITAFTNHLLTVSGIYNGLVPAVPSPIPGPPFPWVGIS
jgi:hypothetical protein